MDTERFLSEYKELGNRIQLPRRAVGVEFLAEIGEAMRRGVKLNVMYRKYSDEDAYEAVLEPYCIKLFDNRWYLLAMKDDILKMFALDRFETVGLSDDGFEMDKGFDADLYFRDSYGVWVDIVNYPVKDVRIAVTRKVANYLVSLPLHHSQRQLDLKPDQSLVVGSNDRGDAILFEYHISPTPDFLAELRKWGNEVIIL